MDLVTTLFTQPLLKKLNNMNFLLRFFDKVKRKIVTFQRLLSQTLVNKKKTFSINTYENYNNSKSTSCHLTILISRKLKPN